MIEEDIDEEDIDDLLQDGSRLKLFELYTGSLSEDDIATVLRFHLLTEYYLEQYIRIGFARGDRLIDSNSFSYAQKLLIVDGAELIPSEYISSLKNLNKLRNTCSHQLNHVVTDADLDRIGSPLGKQWTIVKRNNPETIDRLAKLCGHLSAALTVFLEVVEHKYHDVDLSLEGEKPKEG